MTQTLQRLYTALTQRRWLALLLGAAASGFATLSLVFVLKLKDFSSNLRDAYEAPPGPIQHILFWVSCAGLAVLFALGVILLVKTVGPRPRGA